MNKKYFEVARLISLESPMRQRVGAALVHPDYEQPIRVAFNRPLGGSLARPFSLHAEEILLLDEGWQHVWACDVYLWRETRRGIIADSKPCPRCEWLLRQAGVRNVFYTSGHGPHFRSLK